MDLNGFNSIQPSDSLLSSALPQCLLSESQKYYTSHLGDMAPENWNSGL